MTHTFLITRDLYNLEPTALEMFIKMLKISVLIYVDGWVKGSIYKFTERVIASDAAAKIETWTLFQTRLFRGGPQNLREMQPFFALSLLP